MEHKKTSNSDKKVGLIAISVATAVLAAVSLWMLIDQSDAGFLD